MDKLPFINQEVILFNPVGFMGKPTWLQSKVLKVEEEYFITDKSIKIPNSEGIEIANVFLKSSYQICWFNANEKLPLAINHYNKYILDKE